MPLGANKAAIMGVSGTAAAGDVVLLSTQTASDDATLDFTSGIDSTYGEYIFKFYDINPADEIVHFQFQASADGGSSYGIEKTSSYFRAYHSEGAESAALGYEPSYDLAEGTGGQTLSQSVGSDADQSAAGELHLFNPSSTTYVKHYMSTANYSIYNDICEVGYAGGYINTTSAIDAIQFSMSSGNFDGTIKMYGVG